MRKLYLMLLANIFGYVVANAIPANPTPEKVLQPDGSTLSSGNSVGVAVPQPRVEGRSTSTLG